MEHIVRALLDAAAFLEFSPDDIVDPDAAVKAMEDIAASLREATPDEVAAIARVCESEATRRGRTPGYEETAEFFANFVDDFGVGASE